MLTPSEPAKCSVGLHVTAKQLAEDAKGIADDIFKGAIDKHRIAILMKEYANLYAELRK